MITETVLQLDNKRLRDLLIRIRGWDQLPETGDGPFWMREIDRILATVPETRTTPYGDQ